MMSPIQQYWLGGSFSTYAYAMAIPLSVADPSGLCTNQQRRQQLRDAIDSRDKALANKLAIMIRSRMR